MPQNSNKDEKAFYSIGEVAEMFGVNTSTLRFWEKQFPNIQPRKSGRNIRMYTPDNIEEIRLVHNLVKVRGMKLDAARSVIKKNHDGAASSTILIERLQAIRDELSSIRKELDSLV